MRQGLIILLGLLSLSACSTQPVIELDKANRTLTPAQARSQFDQFKGKPIAWGGMIINTKNTPDYSQIEVLAYPIDEDAEPTRSAKPQDRFLIRHTGFLEPAEYAQGRWVSVRGELTDLVDGKIGDTRYTYPRLQAQQLHLWPKGYDSERPNTRFHFGIGVTFGR